MNATKRAIRRPALLGALAVSAGLASVIACLSLANLANATGPREAGKHMAESQKSAADAESR